MIEMKRNSLKFAFPELHKDAAMRLEFQRTLRIPDDDNVYSLPPGLGSFPVRHVDDFSDRVSEQWKKHGGVMLPMFQSEAMWINFTSSSGYPFLVKIATGKINAVTGDEWQDEPQADPQDYVVIPEQPWLDGYCVDEGEIRQFVAMTLGKGYTVEEQVTGEAIHGGLQLIVYPMKADEWEKRKPRGRDEEVFFSLSESFLACPSFETEEEMGLAPGGRMKQKIYDDPYGFSVWDLEHSSRCFVHITNSITWRAITGEAPPSIPPTAKQYTEAGLPWFDYYAPSNEVVVGSDKLSGLKSVDGLSKEKGEKVLPENETASVPESQRVKLGNPDQVREGW
jgi:hypothetical protein